MGDGRLRLRRLVLARIPAMSGQLGGRIGWLYNNPGGGGGGDFLLFFFPFLFLYSRVLHCSGSFFFYIFFFFGLFFVEAFPWGLFWGVIYGRSISFSFYIIVDWGVFFGGGRASYSTERRPISPLGRDWGLRLGYDGGGSPVEHVEYIHPSYIERTDWLDIIGNQQGSLRPSSPLVRSFALLYGRASSSVLAAERRASARITTQRILRRCHSRCAAVSYACTH